MIEIGKKFPSPEMIEKLADALGVKFKTWTKNRRRLSNQYNNQLINTLIIYDPERTLCNVIRN